MSAPRPEGVHVCVHVSWQACQGTSVPLRGSRLPAPFPVPEVGVSSQQGPEEGWPQAEQEPPS